MTYRISHAYCWYNNGSQIVKMYFINEIPFTFDEIDPEVMYDIQYMEAADKQRTFDPEDLYKSSFYLIDEQAHPLMFELELENPEDLPQD
jgi:hypothetical protein